ncbi:response regulator [Azospirillum sp. RWY-5-1]|uniref:histidine kinase n=1 Tax=Azospirillum oleiclasticum TaxID=2735135 RepID=A0ABX2T633_9PROT|nr:ATP-binding protein [Azospirillum oleiclasticum]NYZ12499.1 response regulator [Azospirillum oleiclasticum]NYZ19659.1 response regulator [Azospirillum oleiclasticum]
MSARQRIVRERRQYNQLAADQTLEDFALRYTAERARTWSPWRVANTALGAISFLACEAIGAAITLTYGFTNAMAAILAVGLLNIIVGLPITYHATRAGVDIDLLTRGAGFGYLGSTITSLVYATFTFILFAIEASIMSAGLVLLLGIPESLAHVISALSVIPIAIYGMRVISRMQVLTQPVWLVLQCLPFLYVALLDRAALQGWLGFTGTQGDPDGSLGLLPFGMACSMLLSLLPQIGEQVDYLRFLPDRKRTGRASWWTAMLVGGPGWVLMGSAKLVIGSLLAYLAIQQGMPAAAAVQPTDLYHFSFRDLTGSAWLALVLAGVFVIVCQLKINVTNAYAGSLAWSNFFSRLTHSHPGRVVWLVFNVLVALMLMQVGILGVIESILALYANVAVGWLGAVAADLSINKPLKLAPRGIEFKRAYLYDINPVGTGAMALSVLCSTAAFFGVAGPVVQALSPFVGLVVAYAAAPAIAWWTGGRYYLARNPDDLPTQATEVRCSICENVFERRDMAWCPAYDAPICSLCCTLDARCHDGCKTESRFSDQITRGLQRLLPRRFAPEVHSRTGHFIGVMALFTLVLGGLLTVIDFHFVTAPETAHGAVRAALLAVFFCLVILAGVAAWLLVLAQDSRRKAEEETARQTGMLMEEIAAHERTDAALQKAKEAAESANAAKSRYIIGLSHEIRAPLNAISGYAQLMEHGSAERPEDAVKVIRRSADHLSNLIDGLLDISKIESGVRRLNREKVRLGDFLDQLVDMFRIQAANKGLEFRYARAANLPPYVNTDAKILRQILINLLSNAVKYTETGHVSFTVRYRSQVAEFEVADTGIGIPEEDRERVFEAFERGKGAVLKGISGTGLGLTFTRLLTRIMGGDISVDSEASRGSIFRVRLLLSEALHTGDEPQEHGRVTGYAGPRIKLLLADDNPVHVALMTDILRPLGFLLTAVSDGEACLKAAEEIRPELVILDISMPGESGWDVAAAIRARFGDAVRILMVSANAYEQQGPAGGIAPHDAFLAKPIELRALLDRIESLMGLEWLREAGRLAVAAEPVPSPPATADGVPPGMAHHLDDLRQLGRIGYVRGIEARLVEVEAEDPANAAFVARLRELLRAFNMKGYMKLLDISRGDGP